MTIRTPICVTGVSGFCGSHIVESLLKNGETVHGTVRDPSSKKCQFLKDLSAVYEAKADGGKLILFAADLGKVGSFDAAVSGCEVVVHVAAVVATAFKKDPFVEVITPNVDSIKNIVGSCKKAGTVKRIVYTSSQATISCAEKFRTLQNRGRPHTEDMWNTHVTPTYGTYNYSKIKAEEMLQEIWDGELISLLPAVVFGPTMTEAAPSSLQIPKLIINKEYKRLPIFASDWVDVRDVAKAHYFACVTKDLPTGRYLLSQGQMLSTTDIAQAIDKSNPELTVPIKEMPWALMWLVSCFDKRIDDHMLYERAMKKSPNDNSKLVAQGFSYDYSNIVATMGDVVTSFKKHGIMKGCKKQEQGPSGESVPLLAGQDEKNKTQ